MIKNYCESALSAKIEIKGNDPPILISEYPTVTIELDQETVELISYSGMVGTPCYVAPTWLNPEPPAVWIWNASIASPKEQEDEIVSFDVPFESSLDQLFDLVVACDNVAEITFNGNRIGTTQSFSKTTTFTITGLEGSNLINFRCINTAIGTTNHISNPGGLYFRLQEKGSCRMIVSDESGEIFNKKFNKCPKYLVACDDDCPEGFIKCSSSTYPGYCCLSCKETASKILALGTKLQ